MSCEDARVLLHAYVDGELDLVHSLEIEKHLENCKPCARAVENQQTLRSAIRGGSLYYQPHPRVGQRISAALRPTPASPRRIYSIIAVAASLLIAGFFAGRQLPRESHTSQEVLDSHLRSLLPGHLADVKSTDQHTVKPWFNGKLNFSPPVTDFAQQGFPLIGGRRDSIGGRDVAALIYQRRQHLINFYVWPAPGQSNARIDKSAQQGYNVMHWTQSGFECWLISDVNATELADLAALLRAAAK
jgi:anti-sigma factor RsiW